MTTPRPLLALLAAVVMLPGTSASAEPLNPPTPPVPLDAPDGPPSGLPDLPVPAPTLPTVEPEPTAAPASQPATRPTTRRAARASTRPATQPATADAANPADADGNGFVTPSEMLAHLRATEAETAAKLQVAHVDLDSLVTERPSPVSIFGGGGTSLRDLIDRLTLARDDDAVRVVLITLGPDTSLNLAQAQEVADALDGLRRAGKRTFVYADTYDTAGYLMASAATDVCLLGGGEVFVPGVGFETTFYKGLFDKLGVEADYVQIGEYKGAEEPYTRTGPSDELAGEMNKLADALYGQLVDQIALHRNLPATEVKRMVDDAVLGGPDALSRGFVDHLLDEDGLRDLIADEMGDGDADDLNLLADYGKEEGPKVDFGNPFALFAALAKKPEASDLPAVALVYAEGVISDGDGSGGLLGGAGVGSGPMREAMRFAERDDKVKAVVIRIDSPGGSALASEVMWQAVRRVAETKPVIISVGGMAASGGYYLASAGDRVFADPAAIVGSIGVVGGKFVLSGLYEKLGITTQVFTRGKNADLYSSTTPFSDAQQRMVRRLMRSTYDQFTARVTAGRGDKIADVDAVARGRIFTAAQAKALGMVDELGGLDAAIEYALDQTDIDGDYDVRVLPQENPLESLFAGASAESPVRSDSILRLMPPGMRRALVEQVQVLSAFERRPVAVIAPFRLVTQ